MTAAEGGAGVAVVLALIVLALMAWEIAERRTSAQAEVVNGGSE
jgi:hypothetical protein